MRRRDILALGVLGAPMINRGRFELFARSHTEYSSRAFDLLERSVVIDMLGLITLDWQKLDRWRHDPSAFSGGDFDKLRTSGITVFRPAVELHSTDPYGASARWLAGWNQFLARRDDEFVAVKTPSDLVRPKQECKIGILLGLQNSEHFRTVDDICYFYSLGQRVSQLTYNSRNRVGYGCFEPRDLGLDNMPSSPLELSVNRIKHESINDRRHRATVTALWDMAGLFRDTNPLLRNVFANFNLSGTWLIESPQYLTALSGADAGLFGFGSSGVIVNPNGQGISGSGLSPLRNSQGRVVGFVTQNPNARFISAAPGVFVNNGPGQFKLNRTNNFDMAAVKGFSFRDRFGFEIRAEAYNVFNHPQFTASQLHSIDFRNLGNLPTFLISSTMAFGGFTDVLSSNPRTLQLALRATF